MEYLIYQMRGDCHRMVVALFAENKVPATLVSLSWKRYCRAQTAYLNYYYGAA